MIASWMLSAMLFSALLGVAALLAESALRTARRQARWPWLVALAGGSLWPLAAPLLRRWFSAAPEMLDVAVAMPSVRVIPDALPGVLIGRWVDVALISMWTAASLVALGRLLHGLMLVRRIRRDSEPRVIEDVPVLVSTEVGPAVIGVWAPRVLIPESLLDLDASLQRLALRHELEHSRANDQVALVGSSIALALMPWNLPLWWVVRRYRLAIEIDCDARVLAREPNARQYGQLLMLIAQRARVPAFAPMLAASTSHLERRIVAMLSLPSPRARARIAVTLVGAVVVAIAACSSRISDVIAGPKPEVAARPAAAGNTDQPWFEFQVNKMATQIPGTGNLRYPDALRAANIEGEVLAQFVVTAAGDVEPGSFKALRSSDPLFTDAVKANLASMKFNPAEVKGVRVRQLVQQPFTFSLGNTTSRGVAIPKKAPETFLGVIKRTAVPTEALGEGNGDRLAQQIPGIGNIRYPDALRKAKVEGEVIAQFVVDTNGTVSDGTFKAIKSNDPLFTEAVRNALPNMRFTPAMVKGKAVRQLLQQPFTFSLSKQ